MGIILKAIRNPLRIYCFVSAKGLTKWVPDEVHLALLYRATIGGRLDLVSPRSFNEKLQWLKLHDRNPLYTRLVDKHSVKQWVGNRIGENYVTKTLRVWEEPEQIELDELPSRFVLKTNHDCGGIAICLDKSNFDSEAAKLKLRKHMNRNYFYNGREWPYKNIKPLIFAEEYLDPGETGELIDYKVMCFNGKARCIFTCLGRKRHDLRVDFFDLNWNHLPFSRHYPNSNHPIEPPSGLSEMIKLSETLSKAIPFVRVDWYQVDGRLYFGEMTFHPGSGIEEFDPVCWDYTLGSWLELPSIANV